jgi:hypothetical protein
MSNQINVCDNFYLVGYATDSELIPITYNGIQIKSTIAGVLTIDGLIPPVTALVLVKNQTNQKQNGIYRVSNNGSTGMYQLDRVSETFGFNKGKSFYVLNGTLNVKTSWVLVHYDNYIVVGVTDVTFCLIGGSGMPSPAQQLATYTLSQFKIKVNNTNWTSVSEFTWNNAQYNTYINGIIVTGTTVINRNVNIRLRDITNNITLGQVLNVATTGPLIFPITNPFGNSILQLQVSKIGTGSTNPIVHGAVLEFIKP